MLLSSTKIQVRSSGDISLPPLPQVMSSKRTLKKRKGKYKMDSSPYNTITLDEVIVILK